MFVFLLLLLVVVVLLLYSCSCSYTEDHRASFPLFLLTLKMRIRGEFRVHVRACSSSHSSRGGALKRQQHLLLLTEEAHARGEWEMEKGGGASSSSVLEKHVLDLLSRDVVEIRLVEKVNGTTEEEEEKEKEKEDKELFVAAVRGKLPRGLFFKTNEVEKEEAEKRREDGIAKFPKSLAFVLTHFLDQREQREREQKQGKEEAKREKKKTKKSFCGVIGCQMHRGAGEHDTLKSQLEKLRPEARKDSKLPTIDRFDERFPCPGDLPALALERIVKNLDAKSAGRLQCVSKGFRAVMDQTSPGLKLTLHPHQRAALAWMRMRERRDSLGVVLEPGWVELFASNDDDDENGNREEFPFYMQTSTGILSRTPPNYFSDSCGGALCDEPGLGKTVTVCALILATRGSYAPPPKGLTIKFEHPEKENMKEKVPYYVD